MISWKKRFRKKKKLFVFTPSSVTGQIKCKTANTVALEDIVYVIPNGPNTLFRNTPLLITQLWLYDNISFHICRYQRMAFVSQSILWKASILDSVMKFDTIHRSTRGTLKKSSRIEHLEYTKFPQPLRTRLIIQLNFIINERLNISLTKFSLFVWILT